MTVPRIILFKKGFYKKKVVGFFCKYVLESFKDVQYCFICFSSSFFFSEKNIQASTKFGKFPGCLHGTYLVGNP